MFSLGLVWVTTPGSCWVSRRATGRLDPERSARATRARGRRGTFRTIREPGRRMLWVARPFLGGRGSRPNRAEGPPPPALRTPGGPVAFGGARSIQRAALPPHVAGVGEAAHRYDGGVGAEGEGPRLRHGGRALHERGRQHEEGVEERAVVGGAAQAGEQLGGDAGAEPAADEPGDGLAALAPCRELQVGGAPAALGCLEAADGEGRELDVGDEPHLELLREAVHRAHDGARGGEVEVRGLRGELHTRRRGLVPVDHDVAPEDALPGGPRGRGAVERALARERPRRARAEQVAEREQVRAAARAADRVGEPPRPAVVEPRPRQRGDAVDRIAAALAGGDRRGLEGHAPLLGGERLERRAPGIDHAGEAHVVDDARALEVAGHRDEAALAEVEHGAVHVELSVGACREDDGEGTRVERVAMGFEAHRSESLRRGAPAQASPGIGPPIWLWRSPMKIAGAVALVTGGASGLGEATVAMVIENGGKAAILDRPGSAGEDVARRLGAQALFAAADVTSAEEVQAAVAKAVERFGAVHVCVNCAGVGAAMRTVTKQGPMPLDLFAKVIAINLTGTFNVLRLAAAQMAQNPPNEEGERGVIINTASAAAFDGQIGQAAYSASKGGVVGMTLPIARDLAALGLRVVTIAPATFDTPLLAMLPEAARESLGKQTPFPPRLGSPGEYARLARHVIENPMLNGETIRLDGALRMPPK